MTFTQRIVISSVIGASLIVITLAWTFAAPTLPQPTSIVKQWNTAISLLGIEPLYPPQEDVAVGDVFLVIAHDNEDESLDIPLAARAMKIWHIDLTDEIEKIYRQIPVFPDTDDLPTSNKQFWKQKMANSSVFEKNGERKNLPLAVFPGFSLARSRQSDGNLGVAGVIPWSASTSGSRSQAIDISIPLAETYGVLSITAHQKLNEFCNSLEYMKYCTETGARRELSSLFGSKIYHRIASEDGRTVQNFQYDVQIMIISRVYLARSIETTIEDGMSFSANGQLKDHQAGQVNTSNASLSNEDASNLPGKDPVPATHLDRASPSAGPGGLLSIVNRNGQKISLVTTLQRPVTIGYRSVNSGLFPE
ncbi:hypothetical protein [Methylobacterium sp. JK268]